MLKNINNKLVKPFLKNKTKCKIKSYQNIKARSRQKLQKNINKIRKKQQNLLLYWQMQKQKPKLKRKSQKLFSKTRISDEVTLTLRIRF